MALVTDRRRAYSEKLIYIRRPMPADIILLAAIAAFVLLRLRSVLGQKTGQDQPPIAPDAVKKEDRVIHIKPTDSAAMVPREPASPAASAPEEPAGTYDAAVEAKVADIRKIDRQFRMKEFLEGAKIAFDMVHEAFRKDDRETLEALLSKDIYKSFRGELETQKGGKEHTESTLVSILSAEPKEVEVEKNKARVTVAFASEQIFVTRDTEGKVKEGSPSAVQRVEDEWVFERDLRSSNPNWTVIAT